MSKHPAEPVLRPPLLTLGEDRECFSRGAKIRLGARSRSREDEPIQNLAITEPPAVFGFTDKPGLASVLAFLSRLGRSHILRRRWTEIFPADRQRGAVVGR